MAHFAPLLRKPKFRPPEPRAKLSPPQREERRSPSFSAPSLIEAEPEPEISEPSDALEVEADRVAEQVVRAPEKAPIAPPVIQHAPQISREEAEEAPQEEEEEEESSEGMVQRACAKCGTDDDDEEGKKGKVQRKAEARPLPCAGKGQIFPSQPQARIGQRLRAERGGGEALPPALRSYMEPRFGRDFSGVRLHRDARADELARDVEAKAFTIGRDVFFREGEFDPETEKGKRLIAHELAHVVQQGEGLQRAVVQREEAAPEKENEQAPHPLGSRWVVQTADRGNLRLRIRAGENVAESAGNLPSGTVVTVIAANDSETDRDARKNGFVPVRGIVEAGHSAAGFVHMRYLVPEGQPEAKDEEQPETTFLEFEFQQGEELEESFGTAVGSARELSDYVDNRVEAVGVGLLLGGYLLFVRGLDRPLFLPEAWVDRAQQGASGLEENIYDNREEALTALQGEPHGFAYHGIVGGLIIPTTFSPSSTPRIAAMIEAGWARLAKEAQEELTYLAMAIPGGIVIRKVIGKLMGVSQTGTAKWRAKQEKVRGEIGDQAATSTPPTSKAPTAEQVAPQPRPQEASTVHEPARPSGPLTTQGQKPSEPGPGTRSGPQTGELYTAHVEGSHGLMASIDGRGTLDLYIKVGPRTPRGGAMFDEAMQVFGSRVKGVRGTWIGGGDLADNFDAFKAAVNGGLKPEQAAFKTFTGHMAEKYGFNKSTIITNTDKKVVVEFTR